MECRRSASELEADALWHEVSAPATPFLAQVADGLSAEAAEFDPEVSVFARYALENRGKQLRPLLVGLSGGAFGPLGPDHVTVGMVVEMIHLATLVHDDVMDVGEVRRGRPTLSSRWGNEVAVLVGDCLFAHALTRAADMGSATLSRRIALATKRVCSGEIAQTLRRKRASVTVSEYFRVVELKTAELFALACELGGDLAGAGADVTARLSRYGASMGVAYQIYDDCVDLLGSEEREGKSLGSDLATGKLTLPMLLLMERTPAEQRGDLEAMFAAGAPTPSDVLKPRLIESGALADALATMELRLADARGAVADLPAGAHARGLRAFPDFLAAKAAALVAQ
jgi:octaprenyl-diphosphate synthase